MQVENLLNESFDQRARERLAKWIREDFPDADDQVLDSIVSRLNKGEPYAYICGYQNFYGIDFIVDQRVLIPRPETEELVEWILKDNNRVEAEVLDIGTGSGCIACIVQSKSPSSKVTAIDVSQEALTVASLNANNLQLDISFIHLDFTNERSRADLQQYDIIISNPPYIPKSESQKVGTSVFNFEPHTALFVQNEEPLLFYKLIADFGKSHLKNGGSIYTELNEFRSKEVRVLFENNGYKVELKEDLQGKVRMLKAYK